MLTCISFIVAEYNTDSKSVGAKTATGWTNDHNAADPITYRPGEPYSLETDKVSKCSGRVLRLSAEWGNNDDVANVLDRLALTWSARSIPVTWDCVWSYFTFYRRETWKPQKFRLKIFFVVLWVYRVHKSGPEVDQARRKSKVVWPLLCCTDPPQASNQSLHGSCLKSFFLEGQKHRAKIAISVAQFLWQLLHCLKYSLSCYAYRIVMRDDPSVWLSRGVISRRGLKTLWVKSSSWRSTVWYN